MNSRAKGAAGERELASLLRTYGYEARRGQQFCGLEGNADVIGVDGIHIECKRTERVLDEQALQQSERDAKRREVPVVMYRRSREKWKVCMRLDAFLMIWGELNELQRQNVSEKIKFSTKSE